MTKITPDPLWKKRNTKNQKIFNSAATKSPFSTLSIYMPLIEAELDIVVPVPKLLKYFLTIELCANEI